MSRKNIKKLINNHNRRLQKLKEQHTSLGLNTPPHILTEIEDIEAAIGELQTELEALEDSAVNEQSPSELVKNPKSRVQIYISDDFSSVSADRQSAAIDAFAAAMRIPPESIEIYRIYAGSVVFDLGVPPKAVQRLRSHLQSNSAQLRLLKVEKIVLERQSGKIEEWIIKEGRFYLVTSAHPTISSGINGKSQRDVDQLQDNDGIPGGKDKIIKYLGSGGHSRLPPGTIILNQYEIQQFLAEGGQGQVYLAHHHIFEKVAIKRLHPHLANDDHIERFKREARISDKLHQENSDRVIFIRHFDRDPTHHNEWFFVMNYANRGSLRDKLAHEAPLPVAEALQLTRQLCNALNDIHRAGYVHGDLKPGNILFHQKHKNAPPILMLNDFGSAFTLPVEQPSDLYSPSCLALPRTMMYVAPEWFDHQEQIDHRVDIYSIGVILYEMLTGRPPFWGDLGNESDSTLLEKAKKEITEKILTEPPPKPSSQQKAIWPKLDETVLKALAKSPEERYKNVNELQKGLTIALQRELVFLRDKIEAAIRVKAWSKAQIPLEKALKIAPDDAPLLEWKEKIDTQITIDWILNQAKEAAAQSNWKEVIQLCRQAKDLSSHNPEVSTLLKHAETELEIVNLRKRITNLYKQGEVEKALQKLERRQAQDPINEQIKTAIKTLKLEIYYKLGQQAYEKTDWPVAIEWFRQARDLDPTFHDAINKLSYAQEQLLIISKNLTELFNQMEVYIKQKNWIDAWKTLKQLYKTKLYQERFTDEELFTRLFYILGHRCVEIEKWQHLAKHYFAQVLKYNANYLEVRKQFDEAREKNRLDANYKEKRLLSQHTSHRVILAEDINANRGNVCLKYLTPDYVGKHKVDTYRFYKRALRCIGVDHPHIAKIYAAEIRSILQKGVDVNIPVIVMQYIKGQNLAELITSEQFAEHQAIYYTRQLCLALQYAHEKNILHLDIKPQNILIEAYGTPQASLKLIDFNHTSYGTHGYRPPEMLQNKPLDQRADIFAVGKVLYAMLSGTLPIEDTLPDATLNFANINPLLRKVIRKATSDNPKARYESANELFEILLQVEIEMADAQIVRKNTWPAREILQNPHHRQHTPREELYARLFYVLGLKHTKNRKWYLAEQCFHKVADYVPDYKDTKKRYKDAQSEGRKDKIYNVLKTFKGKNSQVEYVEHRETSNKFTLKNWTGTFLLRKGKDFIRRIRRQTNHRAKLLTHDNILKIHYVEFYSSHLDRIGSKDDQFDFDIPIVVMEYFESKNLVKFLENVENDFSLNHTLELMQQLCRALQYAHERGIYHLNIKPSNILIQANSNNTSKYLLKLDFAPATYEAFSANDNELKKQEDIAAAGKALYVFLTNDKWPTDATFLDKHNSNFTGLNPLHQTIIYRACKSDASKRYQSIDEMRKDLKVRSIGLEFKIVAGSIWQKVVAWRGPLIVIITLIIGSLLLPLIIAPKDEVCNSMLGEVLKRANIYCVDNVATNPVTLTPSTIDKAATATTAGITAKQTTNAQTATAEIVATETAAEQTAIAQTATAEVATTEAIANETVTAEAIAAIETAEKQTAAAQTATAKAATAEAIANETATAKAIAAIETAEKQTAAAQTATAKAATAEAIANETATEEAIAATETAEKQTAAAQTATTETPTTKPITSTKPPNTPIRPPEIITFNPENLELRPNELISITAKINWNGYDENYQWSTFNGSIIENSTTPKVTYQAPITEDIDIITLTLAYDAGLVEESTQVKINKIPKLPTVKIDSIPPQSKSDAKTSIKIFRWKWPDEYVAMYQDLSFELQIFDKSGNPIKLREEQHSLPLPAPNIYVPVSEAKSDNEDFFFIEFDTAWLPHDSFAACDVYWRITVALRPGYLGCGTPEGYETNEICRVTDFVEPEYGVTGIRRADAICGPPSTGDPDETPSSGGSVHNPLDDR